MTVESPLEVLTSERRGSLGDTVYSRNSFGQYERARTPPTQPTGSAVDSSRLAMNELMARWNTLTQSQRDGWAIYAASIAWSTPLNHDNTLQPNLHYLRSNMPRRMLGTGYVDDAPTILGLPWFTKPTISLTITPPPAPIRVTVLDEEWWHNGSNVLYFASTAAVPGTWNYYQGPYSFFGSTIFGDNSFPPNFTSSFGTPFSFATGEKVPFSFRLSMGDGRLSKPLRFLVQA